MLINCCSSNCMIAKITSLDISSFLLLHSFTVAMSKGNTLLSPKLRWTTWQMTMWFKGKKYVFIFIFQSGSSFWVFPSLSTCKPMTITHLSRVNSILDVLKLLVGERGASSPLVSSFQPPTGRSVSYKAAEMRVCLQTSLGPVVRGESQLPLSQLSFFKHLVAGRLFSFCWCGTQNALLAFFSMDC